jgi:hypothetical protein
MIAVLLGMVADFITDPFSWLGFAALIVSKKWSRAAPYRRVLLWVFWIGCGVAAFNSISYAIRSLRT